MRMKYRIDNQNGIALVMVLVLALIALGIVSALIYMLTQGTTISGAQKFYRTAEEASYGGMEVATGYLSNRGLLNIAALPGLSFTANCNCRNPTDYTDNIDNMTGAASARCDKLCNPTSQWTAAALGYPVAEAQALDATLKSDMQFTLGVAPATFNVFAKIVDTVEGNTDVGGIVTSGSLGGFGVVYGGVGSGGTVTPAHIPYLYRLEIQSQATNNPRERARLSVLYAF